MHNETRIPYELQRIADALEANNKINKAVYEQNEAWIAWNKATRQENLDIDEKRREQDLALSERRCEEESKKNDDRANKFNEEILDLYRTNIISPAPLDIAIKSDESKEDCAVEGFDDIIALLDKQQK